MLGEKSISVCLSPCTRTWSHLEKSRDKIETWWEVQKAKLFSAELVDISKAYISPLLYITLNRGEKRWGKKRIWNEAWEKCVKYSEYVVFPKWYKSQLYWTLSILMQYYSGIGHITYISLALHLLLFTSILWKRCWLWQLTELKGHFVSGQRKKKSKANKAQTVSAVYRNSTFFFYSRWNITEVQALLTSLYHWRWNNSENGEV